MARKNDTTTAPVDGETEDAPAAPDPNADDELRADLAKKLGLEPTAAEIDAGYKTPADVIFAVADLGDAWGVVTINGRKHRVAK